MNNEQDRDFNFDLNAIFAAKKWWSRGFSKSTVLVDNGSDFMFVDHLRPCLLQ